jgi:hypothetical protein
MGGGRSNSDFCVLVWEQWEQWEHRINSGLQRSQPVPSHPLDWEQLTPHKCAKVRRCIGLVSGAYVCTYSQRGKSSHTPA